MTWVRRSARGAVQIDTANKDSIDAADIKVSNKTTKPYLGAGVNYTRFSSVKLPQGTALGALTIDKNSVGLALQAGVDYALDGKWSLNLDVKKVQIRTDLKSGAAGKLGKIKVDPLLIGVGLGYKF